MGMFLIIWDKLFGTFQPELHAAQFQPLRYGLTKPIEREPPVTIVFHEWSSLRKDLVRREDGWRDKLFCILACQAGVTMEAEKQAGNFASLKTVKQKWTMTPKNRWPFKELHFLPPSHTPSTACIFRPVPV